MKGTRNGPFTITLQNRLALSYALFISLALGLLTLVINHLTGLIFNGLVKDNIAEKSGEIVRVIGDLYNPLGRSFDHASVEALGMHFVHEGYLVTVEDAGGDVVWNARSCDMQECVDVISGIASRMEANFRVNGGIQKQRYPVYSGSGTVGTIIIETYGPFFYSETETRFVTSINRLLLMATAVLTLFSIGISVLLSRAIARPVNKSAEAARQLAKRFRRREAPAADHARSPAVSIPDRYQTRELAELSRSINALAEELEAGERRQRQLIIDIAHELRTPLACLQGDIEAMIDGVYRPDREHLESCHEEIVRLTGLVQDLTTLTALEGEGPSELSKPLHKTGFDLAKLLQGTADQFRAAAGEKGIALNLRLRESPVIADYDRLKQVFINLLANALTYTDRGSITVTVEGAGDASPACWIVSVADTGIGIPEGDLPRIFERLYRSDKSRSRSTGGAGIGLAIAAAIVHAHGGTIGAENRRDGSGSVFRVELPLLSGIRPG
ncbi:MAG: HAMP domain-containing protein [Spirochaetaceae bacterium]|jgi:signal transduction histidine kinase|nr:HAMP domain-containing protein [Spirochaetaceae bacterium]